MTTYPSATPTVPTSTAGVPCAARPGTPFRHPAGPCQCFFGGAAPELATGAYPGPATSRRTTAA